MAKLIDLVPTDDPLQPPAAGRALLGQKGFLPVAVAIDAFVIMTGFVVAYWMRYAFRWPPPFELIVREVATENFVPLVTFLPYGLGLLVLLLTLYAMKGLYRLPRSATILDHVGIILSSTTTGIAVLIVVVFLYQPSQFYSRLVFAFAWGSISFLLILWRTMLIWFLRWRWAQGLNRERVLVVGGKGLGRSVMEGIVAHPFLGYHLVGYLEDTEDVQDATVPSLHFHYLGPVHELETLLQQGNAQRVILALPFWEQHRLPELVSICRNAGVEFRIAPDLYNLSFDRVQVDQLSGLPLIGLKTVSLRGWNLWLKRTMDVVIILVALPFVLLLGGLIALAIRLDSPGPVIFRQTRVGRNGHLFTAYKFRTMVHDAEARKAELAHAVIDGRLFKLPNDPRRTRVGRVLRRTSMDELPQLFNVVRGDMSLVGPRPQIPEEVAQYGDWHLRRLEVMPGMTGLWQVLGRNDTSFDEMVRLDIYYAENWSLDMDVRILLQTIPAVLSGRGAY